MAKHISMRGEAVDMNKLMQMNGAKPALGNAQLNARGDKLGPNGIVIKTQEQILAEWKATKEARDESVKTANIKADDIAPVAMKQPPAKQLNVDDQAFEEPVVPAPRRKIIDTNE
jgi:hypothetical protein